MTQEWGMGNGDWGMGNIKLPSWMTVLIKLIDDLGTPSKKKHVIFSDIVTKGGTGVRMKSYF